MESKREDLFSSESYAPQTDYPGSIGHFDWLRSTPTNIEGVRIWPFDDHEHQKAVADFISSIRRFKSVVIHPDLKSVSLLFNLEAIIDEEISNDQDLGEAGIYLNKKGEYALCFEVQPEIIGQFNLE